MYLEAVLVCNQYVDLLAVTVLHNLAHFDRLVVVTSDEDNDTPNLCEQFGVECIISTKMRTHEGRGIKPRRRGPFNKGAMLNDGFAVLSQRDWILVTDADIVLPENFRDHLEATELDIDLIYGCRRDNVTDLKAFIKTPGDCPRSPELDAKGKEARNIGVGYFQLFNANADTFDEREIAYNETWGHAARSDREFARGVFGKKSIKNLEWLRVLHLMPGEYRQNWKGRQATPEEIEILKQPNYSTCDVPIWVPVWKECDPDQNIDPLGLLEVGPPLVGEKGAATRKDAETAPIEESPATTSSRPPWLPPWELGKLSPSKEELEWLHNFTRKQRPANILEFGCGASTWSMRHGHSEARYLGVETHPDALAWMEHHLSGLGIRGDWEFEDYAFDFCFLDSSAPIDKKGYYRHEALIAAEPHLEDGAIVIIHDSRKRGGAKPMAHCVRSPCYKLIEEFAGRTGMAAWKYTKPSEGEWLTDYSDITLTVACTEDYFHKANYAVESLMKTKGFNGCFLQLCVGWYPNGITCGHSSQVVRVDYNGETPRERALAALVLGAAEHTETKYSFKIDAETIAVDDQPFIRKGWLDYDLVGQKWGYTRGSHMMFADAWIDGLWRAGRIKRGEFKGLRKPYIFEGDPSKPHRLKYKCPRIASGWGRLCTTQLLKEIAECHDYNRLVVPSEDSLLSAWCERLGLPWLGVNWKDRGLVHHGKFLEGRDG